MRITSIDDSETHQSKAFGDESSSGPSSCYGKPTFVSEGRRFQPLGWN